MGTMTRTFYEHLVVNGNSYERGFQQGEHLAAKIKILVDYYLNDSRSLPPWEFCLKIIRNSYIPAIEKYDQLLIDELRGISEGSGIAIEYIFLLNARYDLSKFAKVKTNIDECTSACVIDKNGVKICQNWDLHSFVHDNDLCVLIESHTAPEENLPKTIFTLGEVGQLGRSGMNSKGLGLCANSLTSTTDIFDFDKFQGPNCSYIPISLSRKKFLSCKIFANGIKYLTQCRRHVSANVMIATHEGEAIDFEVTPYTVYPIHPMYVEAGKEVLPYSNGQAVLVHSNHFISPNQSQSKSFACLPPGGSTFFRHRRLLTKICDKFRSSSEIKGVSIDDMKYCLSDTLSFPNSLSEAPNSESEPPTHASIMTVASAIYDLENGIISICKGPPHLGNWREYRIELE